MPKVGGTIVEPNPGGGTLSLNAVAVTALLGGTASYEVIDHVHLALAAWLAYVASPSIDYSSSVRSPFVPFNSYSSRVFSLSSVKSSRARVS